MNITRRAALAAPLIVLATRASAQAEWPKGQPIKVLIPFAPGGVPDIISRIVTPKMKFMTRTARGNDYDPLAPEWL